MLGSSRKCSPFVQGQLSHVKLEVATKRKQQRNRCVPYPAWVEESTKWPSDTRRHEVTVAVPRGLLVRGRVVEEDSGAGVAGAGVEYQLCRDISPYFKRSFASQIYWAGEVAAKRP